MDVGSMHAIRLLEALAESKEKFTEAARQLRGRPGVTRVLESLECLKYGTYALIEGYVDTELSNGKAVAWWLEVHWRAEEWVIESRVLLNDNVPRSGQEVVQEFPTRTASTLEGCIDQLQKAVLDLVVSTDSITAFLAD